jgi:ComF family protein
MSLRRCFDMTLDALFPPFCVSCKKIGSWWCDACRNIQRVSPEDSRIEGIDGALFCGYYHDPQLRAAIQALKYHGVTELHGDLRTVIQERVSSAPAWLSAALGVVPLPATTDRVRARGFDQAHVIADIIHECLGAQMCDVLRRERGNGIAQAQIHDHALRRLNVKNVFACTQDVILPHAVLLVDDVMTSGATVVAAASCLRERGVSNVYAFALARGA